MAVWEETRREVRELFSSTLHNVHFSFSAKHLADLSHLHQAWILDVVVGKERGRGEEKQQLDRREDKNRLR